MGFYKFVVNPLKSLEDAMNFPDDFVNKIIVGDCVNVMRQMPDECVDIAITSPPYNHLGTKTQRAQAWSTSPGMFANNTWRDKVTTGGVYFDQMPEPEYQEWLRQIVAECLRISKGIVWINHKTRYRDGVGIHPLSFLQFPLYSEVVWNRGGSMALNSKRFAPSHEFFYGFGKPCYWNDECNKYMSVWNVAPKRDDGAYGHPCPYPIKIIRRLIKASCPDGGVVFDPFGGISSTAVAALRENARY